MTFFMENSAWCFLASYSIEKTLPAMKDFFTCFGTYFVSHIALTIFWISTH